MRKLDSEKGASILFALLLFLVCAVLSAVILTAATASTGRISGMADTDSRYYAVSSAARLVSDELAGGSVTVLRNRRTVTTKTERYVMSGSSVTGTPLADTVGEPSYETVLNGRALTSSATKNDMSFIEQIAMDVVFGASGSYVGEDAWGHAVRAGDSACDYSFTVKPDGGKAPEVKLSASLANDGTLTLAFSDADSGDRYTLTVVMDIDVYEDGLTTSSSDAEPVVTDTGSGYEKSVDHTDTVCKNTSVRWTVREVKKG